MMVGLPVTTECRDQSVLRRKAGSGSTAGKEAAPLCSTHSGLGGGAYSVQSVATSLPGCCPQLAGSNRFNIPVPPKSAQIAPRHRIHSYRLTQRRNASGQRVDPVRLMKTCDIFEAQANIQQLWVCVTSCITRDRGPQLAAGAG